MASRPVLKLSLDPVSTSGKTIVYETITPTIAAAYLERNVNNRPVRRKQVERLAAKIRDGRWLENHQGIAFGVDGSLLDGQHRLLAIIAAGLPVVIAVARGLPTRSVVSMDENEVRTVADVYGALVVGGEASNADVATARRMSASIGEAGKLNRDKEYWIQYITRHRDAIRFGGDAFRSKLFNHAAFRAVAARAWYTRDHARIAEFASVVITGLANGPRDYAAVTARNWFLKSRAELVGQPAVAGLYRKLESTLSAFLEDRSVTVARDCSRELFPIPGDK